MTKSDISLGTKIIFGTGEIPIVAAKTVMSILFLYYLTDVVDIPPAIAGTIFMLGRIWDAVNDPLMGIISDRTRTRWGRRRPYFLFTALPMGALFIIMFYPYAIADPLLRACAYGLAYIAFTTALTAYVVPYLGLMSELTDDYSERTSINNWRIVFSLVFGLAAAVLPKMLADSYDDAQRGYLTASLTVAAAVTIFPVVLFAGIRERARPPAPRAGLEVFRHARAVIANKAFRSLLLIYVGCFAGINVIEGFVVYYMKYWIGREDEMPILFVCVVLSSLVSLPAWGALSRRIGKERTVIGGLGLWAVTQLLWIPLTPATPSSVVYLVGVVVGLGYGCAHVLPWAMFPDVIDYDELETGERREGLYSGVMTFAMKTGNALALWLIGWILQLSGYVANAEQTPTALGAIHYTMAAAPLLFIIIGLVAATKYPITRDRYTEIRAALDERHAAERPS